MAPRHPIKGGHPTYLTKTCKPRITKRVFSASQFLFQSLCMKKIYSLSLSFLFCLPLMAQSPGGVSATLSLWLRADAASTLSSTDSLNNWAYFNIPAFTFASSPHNRPIVQSSTFNFLPSVFFNGVQEMNGPTGSNAPITAGNPAYAIFAVWSSKVSSETPQRVWIQDATDFQTFTAPWGTTYNGGVGGGLWVYNGEYGDQDEISPYTQGLGLSYNPSQPYISEVNLLAQNTSDVELVDQTNIAGATVVLNSDPFYLDALADRFIANTVNRLGCRAVPTEEPFIGNLAELIVYNNNVNGGAARNQIFSYLSMKYGIPIGISLLSSAGATVWNATANSTYNHGVFGLALDNNSSLSVNQSNNATTGSGNGTGQSGSGNIILTAVNPITVDQSFLMIGNDNGVLTETTSNVPAAASGSSRLIRNWKVANTNSVGPVNLSFDFTGLAVTGAIGTAADFRLMVNEAGDPTFATGATTFYGPSFTGNVATFNNVTLPDQAVFAILSNAAAGTPLPVNFVSFAAQPNGNNVDLSWVVGDNNQASTYKINHSTDGVHFISIGEVANDAEQQAYSFVQVNAGPGQHYYQVLETDLDGKTMYSNIVSVTIAAGDFSVAVLNNPAAGNTDVQLQINATTPGTALIELWTTGGARISLQQQAIGAGVNTFSIPVSKLPSGSYVVKVQVNNNMHVSQLIKL